MYLYAKFTFKPTFRNSDLISFPLFFFKNSLGQFGQEQASLRNINNFILNRTIWPHFRYDLPAVHERRHAVVTAKQ